MLEGLFKPIKPNNQRLLVHAMNNGGITFREQEIYNSTRFYKEIQFLRRNNYIKPVCSICQKKLDDETKRICKKRNKEHHAGDIPVRRYNLTLKGEIVVFAIRANR